MKTVEERLLDLERRVAELEADADKMPAYANRFLRLASGGESTDGFGPSEQCQACNGDGYLEIQGEYENLYQVGLRKMRICGECGGKRIVRKRLTVQEQNALRD